MVLMSSYHLHTLLVRTLPNELNAFHDDLTRGSDACHHDTNGYHCQ